eukprot:g38115.t1
MYAHVAVRFLTAECHLKKCTGTRGHVKLEHEFFQSTSIMATKTKVNQIPSPANKKKVKTNAPSWLAGDVPSCSPHKKLIMCKSDTTLEDALALLDHYNIQSCPFEDAKHPKKILGVINVVDILTRIVFDKLFAKEDIKAGDLTNVMKKQGNLLKSLTVTDARGLSLEGKRTWVLAHGDDLTKALNYMASGVHRVLVALPKYSDPNAKLEESLGYISQKDVIRFLVKEKDECTMAVLNRPVSAVAKDGVMFVKTGTTALKTFQKMLLENEMSALPIVDQDGKIVDTVSVSDVRNLRGAKVGNLLMPIEEFMKQAAIDRLPDLRNMVKCKPTDKVEHVLSMLLHSKVHRAWVVDDDDKPVGAIGFTDIFRAIFLFDPFSPSKASLKPSFFE